MNELNQSSPLGPLLIAALVSTLTFSQAAAQVTIGSTAFDYSQDFDTLQSSGDAVGDTWTNNSTLPGWSWTVQDPAIRNPEAYGYNVSDGGGTPGSRSGGQSYGATSTTERAIGLVAATGQVAVSFHNDTGSAIDLSAVNVGFAIEQWDRNTVAPVMTFSYAITPTALTAFTDGDASWTAKGEATYTGVLGSDLALDGNLAENRQVFSSIVLSDSSSLGAGEYLTLRWQVISTSSGTGGLAVDNFSIQAIPEPSSWGVFLGIGALGFAALRRRNFRG